MSDKDLGAAYDDVDLLGYNGFGEPEGLGALYGGLIGAGVATAAEIGTQEFWPAYASKKELVGLAAGVLTGGLMMVFPQTRHAGVTAAAVTVVTHGLRAAQKAFGGAAAPATTTAGWGAVRATAIPRAHGLAAVQAEQLNGNLRLLGSNQANMSAHYGHSYARR